MVMQAGVDEKPELGIIILAAGKSARLSHPKQLLPYNQTSLLQHSIDAAQNAAIGKIVVVLGASRDSIYQAIDKNPVHTVMNADWAEGMASSIRSGLRSLLQKQPRTQAAILMVCDQPFVHSGLLRDLVSRYNESASNIVASGYNNISGVPALFDQRYFSELLLLAGEEGARRLIKKYAADVATVPFPLGHIDIDAHADYQQLLNSQHDQRQL